MPPILPENLIPGNMYVVSADWEQTTKEFVNFLEPYTFARFKKGTGGAFISYNIEDFRFYNPADPDIPPPPPPPLAPPAALPKLNVAAAPHLGDKIEGVDLIIEAGDRNGVSGDGFNEGDEVVGIRVALGGIKMPIDSEIGYHLFHVDDNAGTRAILQGWFDTVTNPAQVAIGRAPIYQRVNPATRQIVDQHNLVRFRYRKPGSGGRRSYFRVKKRKTKSRNTKIFKKTIKRRR